MGFHIMNGTLASRNKDGSFNMVCVSCLREINGSIDGSGLAIAIRDQRGKGGIKCKQCTSMSCGRCGIVESLNLVACVLTGEDVEEKEEVKLCTLCFLEMSSLGMASDTGFSPITLMGVELSGNRVVMCPNCKARSPYIRRLREETRESFCTKCYTTLSIWEFLTEEVKDEMSF